MGDKKHSLVDMRSVSGSLLGTTSTLLKLTTETSVSYPSPFQPQRADATTKGSSNYETRTLTSQCFHDTIIVQAVGWSVYHGIRMCRGKMAKQLMFLLQSKNQSFNLHLFVTHSSHMYMGVTSMTGLLRGQKRVSDSLHLEL